MELQEEKEWNMEQSETLETWDVEKRVWYEMRTGDRSALPKKG
jgi:hypothetical protein